MWRPKAVQADKSFEHSKIFFCRSLWEVFIFWGGGGGEKGGRGCRESFLDSLAFGAAHWIV